MMEQNEVSRITLDFRVLENMQQVHEELAKELEFPEYYGNNLDALYDCLTEYASPVELTLITDTEKESWAAAFCRVCVDAAEENPQIKVEIKY